MSSVEFTNAPHLIDVEYLHALRGIVRRGVLTDEEARGALAHFADLRVVRHAHGSLRERVWELRGNLSAYDATYVALAEILRLPLITMDGRLARSKGHEAEIELFE